MLSDVISAERDLMITHTNKEYGDYEIVLHDTHGEYTGCLAELPNTDPAISAHRPEGEIQAMGVEAWRRWNDEVMATWVRCQVIWDGYALQSAIEHAEGYNGNDPADGAGGDHASQRVNDAFHAMFGDRFDDLMDSNQPDGATLWAISGRIQGLRRAFQTLFDALNRRPSGDDDFFDYWPNTMDMLYEFASDMDKLVEDTLGDDGGYRAKVADMANAIYTEIYNDGGGESADEWGHATRWPNPLATAID